MNNEGWIYIGWDSKDDEYIKIGLTSDNNTYSRSHSSQNPDYGIELAIKVDNYKEIECIIHNLFERKPFRKTKNKSEFCKTTLEKIFPLFLILANDIKIEDEKRGQTFIKVAEMVENNLEQYKKITKPFVVNKINKLLKEGGVPVEDFYVEEETPKEEEPKAEKQSDHVVINDDGVFLNGKDGARVSITDEGVKCVDKNGKVKNVCHDKAITIINCIEGFLFTLAIVGYILLGTLLGLWTSAWCIIFIPDILCSIARAIRKKNAQHFNMAFLACFAFFFVCMVLPAVISGFPVLWHPMWVVFLAIPAFHSLCGGINKAVGKKIDDCECCKKDNKDVIDAENVEVKDQ